MEYKINIIYIFIIVIIVALIFHFYVKNNSQEMANGTTVYGIIEEIYLKAIPSKVAGKAPRMETWIELKLTEVYDYKNKQVNLSEYNYPTFAGKKELEKLYTIGDKVKIICTSKTGRHISTIEKIEKIEN